VTRRGYGPLQIAYQILHWAVLIAGDGAQRPPVMPVCFESQSLEQCRRGHVVRVRNERHVHPWSNRLILEVEMPRVPAGPKGKDDCPGDRHAKCHR